MRVAEKNLRGAVPERDDFVCVAFHWNAECTAQAEVCNLKPLGLSIDQQVLRLQVSAALRSRRVVANVNHCFR
jgi:hypothetical protein